MKKAFRTLCPLIIFLIALCVIHGYFTCWWTHDALPPGYSLQGNGYSYRYYHSNTFFSEEWGSHWTKRGAIGAAWRDHHLNEKSANAPAWKPIAP